MNQFCLTTRPVGEFEKVAAAAERLILLHRRGALGGEVMPEDANPGLPGGSEHNFRFFTLPMALNYQRDAYKLWASAKETYEDPDTVDVFSPQGVIHMEMDALRDKLLRHKLALQPNRHPEIWMRLCQTFASESDGSVKGFLAGHDFSVARTKTHMLAHKKQFPYLSGAKIMNYWLYVLSQYTDAAFADRAQISVAPDTHVLQASVRLGLIQPGDLASPRARELVSELWALALRGTQFDPIDVHTPLWLWSRGGFVPDVEAS